jgi:hypothetical protein
MNNVDKTILLAEKFGADTSLFTSSYVENIIKSPEFVALTKNVSHASEFHTKKALDLVEDYKSINYDVHSFEEAVILSSRVNYLFTVSSESYYLNPLEMLPFPTEIQSLGELRCPYGGEDRTFNEIIADENHPLNFKARAIAGKCEYWRTEFSEIISGNYQKTKDNQGIAAEIKRASIWVLIDFVCALSAVLASLYSLLTNRTILRSVWASFNQGLFWDWGIVLFAAFAFLLLFSWVLVFARQDRLFSPYRFFKRYGQKGENRVHEKVALSAQRLADYIFAACKEKRQLKGHDITAFNTGVTLYKEIDAYRAMYNYRQDPRLNFFKALFRFFLTMTILAAVYCLVVYFVSKYMGKII